jgi:hypothetical protein
VQEPNSRLHAQLGLQGPAANVSYSF